MVDNKRLLWLDISKAIAIILMVLGHSALPIPVSRFIWAFHMPLFFIASGWTTNWQKYNVLEFAKAKARTLIVPFAIYSACVLMIQVAFGWNSVAYWLQHGWVAYALWFIPVLYVALFGARSVYAINHEWVRLGVMIIILTVGALLCKIKVMLPWSLSSVPYAIFMVVLGGMMRQRLSPKMLQPKWWKITSLFLLTVCISHFYGLDLCFNNILPIVPLSIGALSGTFMVFYMSMLIERHLPKLTGVLTAIGRETYVIVAFSQIIIMAINALCPMNIAIKYGILVVLLFLLKCTKDIVNKLLKTKIL